MSARSLALVVMVALGGASLGVSAQSHDHDKHPQAKPPPTDHRQTDHAAHVTPPIAQPGPDIPPITDADRVENIRRVGEVAKLMTDAGLIVLTAFISPFRSERRMVRELLAEGEFVEIHIDTPLAVAESRDVKGLYRKARAGMLKNFTGIDSPYESPESPEIRIDTTTTSAEEAAEMIVAYVLAGGSSRL